MGEVAFIRNGDPAEWMLEQASAPMIGIVDCFRVCIEEIAESLARGRKHTPAAVPSIIRQDFQFGFFFDPQE